MSLNSCLRLHGTTQRLLEISLEGLTFSCSVVQTGTVICVIPCLLCLFLCVIVLSVGMQHSTVLLSRSCRQSCKQRVILSLGITTTGLTDRLLSSICFVPHSTSESILSQLNPNNFVYFYSVHITHSCCLTSALRLDHSISIC
jgi:hypothetical protein